MPVVSAIFLVIALVLAVVIGPQTRSWTWGPAMLALGAAVLAAVPVIWRRGKCQGDFVLLGFGALTAGWYAWRAWASPVAELGQADMLLLGGAVGAFVAVRAVAGNAAAERVLGWGIALLLGAGLWVAWRQWHDPAFSPVFHSRAATNNVTGFAAHYNEAANFYIGASLLVAGAGLFGRHATATRIIWILAAAAGLACVWLTRSRGGVFGAAVGLGVLAAIALVIGKRRNAKWFAPALVALPLIGLAVGAFWILGWQTVQEARGGKGDINMLLDNNARLYFLGIALSCIALHPLAGGGSQSFSWECLRFVQGKDQGDIIAARPDLVHNELVQAATDYGLIGSGLLVGLLIALVLAAVARTAFEERPREIDARDAWRAGALAALAGMFVQSCFSFVFHLIPGVMLLGICLGQLSRTDVRPHGAATVGARVLLTMAAIGCAVLLLPAGIKGTRVSWILWPSYFGDAGKVSPDARIDALSEALRIWPQSEFLRDRAMLYQNAALSLADGPGFREPADLAIENYLEAAALHPFEPSYPINRANLLSMLGRDEEAEAAYALGIRLQGGMEPGFRGHFSLAKHHLRKSLRLSRDQDPAAALSTLELAAAEIENASAEMHWVIADMNEPRLVIHESLGVAREQAGDIAGALAAYDFAASLRGGRRVNYRAGLLLGKKAVADWSARKPSEALAGFIEARRRADFAANELPEGVNPADRVDYIKYLDRMIAFLKGAKVEPAK